MLGLRHVLSCLALAAALALSGPGAALATSAGDQQYVDPLAQSHNGSTTPSSSSGSSNSSGANSSSSSSGDPSVQSSAVSASASSASTATTATGSTSSAKAALPRTGFSAGLIAMIGLALLGAGFAVRRVLRSA